jgi:hypothetical protein
MNSSLLVTTLLGNYSINYKFNIFTSLFLGMWNSMSGTGFALLVISAILTGINLSLLVKKVKSLRSQGNLKVVVGGSTLIGIVSSGCASCGLPILALLGLSGSVAYLPFRGIELSSLSVILLLFSLYHLIKANSKNECEII